MKILLFGKGGQVGWELQRSLAPLGELVALGSRGESLASDFTEPEALAATVRAVRPDVIVNAAAYTAVDKAEADADNARRVNALAPAVLAREARECGALLVHYSTDYVFDGSGQRPWREDDATGPLNVYGATKLEGEQAIRASGARHLVLRTSWVYAARGGNFAKTMLRLAQERPRLTVVSDQVGAPTGADLLADVTAHAIRAARAAPALAGTYHVAARGETSWCDYARFVLAQAAGHGLSLQATADAVEPVPSASMRFAAARPANSRLDCARFESAFDLRLPHWQAGVGRLLETLLGSK